MSCQVRKERPAVIMAEDLVFRYFPHGKRNILDHVSLEIYDGITLIMGSSGCGKSTLAAVLAGLYPENGGYLKSGSISLYGHDLKDLNAQKRAAYLSVLFQNPSLQFCMDTLRHEMEFCLENICVPAEKMEAEIRKTAADLHVEKIMDQPLHSLSGGEMQKAELACLFLIGSRCILMDEPFANIDEDAAEEIIDLMRQMRRAGRSFVIIDHRVDFWLKDADEIMILGRGGKVLARNLRADTLMNEKDLIRREGLYCPEISIYPLYKTHALSDKPAVTLNHLTLLRKDPRRHLFRRREEADLSTDNVLLQDVSASFPEGEMSAVIGPSGAGKTTLFHAMLKQKKYLGRICYGEQELAEIKEEDLLRRVGIVFQNPADQFVTQNVKEEVRQSLLIWQKGLSDDALNQRAEELLAEYKLDSFAKYSPYMLSQGQQRRLAVLSVLCGKQKILFLDEPTYGQDYASTMAIMNQLKVKMKTEGLTVIFITHDRVLAEACASRIYRLHDKTLLQER